MAGSAFLLNIPPISFFAFQIEKSEPRGNVTKNRRFIKNSFDVLLLFRFKVGHQMTPNGKPSPKLKIPCANNTCGFDPHHRHKKEALQLVWGAFFLSAACERVEQHDPAQQGSNQPCGLLLSARETLTTGIKRKPSSLSGGLSFYLRRVSGSNSTTLHSRGAISPAGCCSVRGRPPPPA